MGAVLGEDAVAGLPLTELPLDDPEGMLDLGPDDGDEAVQLCVERIHGASFGALRMTPQLSPGPLNTSSRAALT